MLNSHKCGRSIHVLKAVAIVTSVHLNYYNFVASHFLIARVGPERRLKVKFSVNSLISFLWPFSFRLVTTCKHLPSDYIYTCAHFHSFFTFRHTYMLQKETV